LETTGYVDYKTATELGLINFKKFVPKSVGLIFKKGSDSESNWIDFFDNAVNFGFSNSLLDL